ncbi:MAG: type II toxin-antitoxin system Phd/YefM family antitoxin [Roseitalea porphyridii]|uniref:type II toxin-antitoxin system Phd/YefM family antitoxin n=1 Tax=Roseitalea porphyridii TaxID=1852022 RepID=UPI0032D97715
MNTLNATDAKNRFGRMIDLARSGPVRIQKNGRDIAVVLSPEEFRRLAQAAEPGVDPLVDQLHEDSIRRYAKVYEALAR